MECDSGMIGCWIVRVFGASALQLALQSISFFTVQNVVAILSLGLAVFKWWKYREAKLHKRLLEYVRESDSRLGPTSRQAVDVILRPGSYLTTPQPTYAFELRKILRRYSWFGDPWQSLFGMFSAEAVSRINLERALSKVRNRHECAQRAEQSLQDQQAHIHLISGAIYAARAKRNVNLEDEHTALGEFRKALSFHRHARNVVAKENEAIQLFRLGQHESAQECFAQMQGYASDIEDSRQRDLTIARAMRYQGQLIQLQAGSAGSTAARDKLFPPTSAPDTDCALTRRYPHAPFTKWAAIEQGELHYLSALVASRLGYNQIEQHHKTMSAGCYRAVLSALPRRNWLLPDKQRQLKQAAEEGLGRAEIAVAQGKYDDKWLGIRSNAPSTQPPK